MYRQGNSADKKKATRNRSSLISGMSPWSFKIKSQIGSMDEEIMCIKEGKDLLIGFNPKFLIDALRVIDDEEVDLYFMNAKAPLFIKDEEQSYIYLILPVNFNAAV